MFSKSNCLNKFILKIFTYLTLFRNCCILKSKVYSKNIILKNVIQYFNYNIVKIYLHI